MEAIRRRNERIRPAETGALVQWLSEGIAALIAGDAERLESLLAAEPQNVAVSAEATALTSLHELLGAMVQATESNLLFFERLASLAVPGYARQPLDDAGTS